jgi:hypothetical protein
MPASSPPPWQLCRRRKFLRARPAAVGGGDVHAFSIAVLTLDDHLAEVDADADLDATILLYRGITFENAPLDRDCTFDGVDDTAKFGEQPIAHEFENAPMVFSDLGLEELFPMQLKLLEGTGLVLLHQPGIADHVG